MPILAQLAIGLALSAVIGWFAYRRGSLSRSGVIGAVIVGTAIFGFGGPAWGLVLITFFVSSSLLSHYKESIKQKLAEKFDKGHQRDLGQVLANGGAGALIASAHLFEATALLGAIPVDHFARVAVFWTLQPNSLLLAGFAGAIATVNADTWSTELGVLNKQPPRLITTWQAVEVGTSGGVSLSGTLAAVAGALLIGVMAAVLQLNYCLSLWNTLVPDFHPFVGPCYSQSSIIAVAAIGGLAGSLFDSLLGATVQAIYFCPTCHKETERRLHTCGTPTQLRRGWRWLNNDLVNFIASLVGAGIAAGIFGLMVHSGT
jgi:uncharacterized membrane protein